MHISEVGLLGFALSLSLSLSLSLKAQPWQSVVLRDLLAASSSSFNLSKKKLLFYAGLIIIKISLFPCLCFFFS